MYCHQVQRKKLPIGCNFLWSTSLKCIQDPTLTVSTTDTMAECLLDLPNEVLQHIFQFLPGKDIAAVARTCRRFHDVTQIEALWQYKCQHDYGISLTEHNNSDVTYHQFYTKLLHQYGSCLGLWKLATSGCLYGMLVHIKLESERITAYHCRAPFSGDVRDPVNVKTVLFTIIMSDSGGNVQCRRHSHADVQIPSRDRLEYRCKECLDLHPKNMNPFRQEEFMMFWTDEMEVVELHSRHDIIARILSMAHSTAFWSRYALERVSLAAHNPLSPVRLGVYKGTYGPHGVELISLVMASNGQTLLGNKLTGDPNVPAGQTSLFIYLHCPMVLTADDQSSLENLKLVKPEIQSLVAPVQPDAHQPFILSSDIELDVKSRKDVPLKLPNTCRASAGKFRLLPQTLPVLCRYHADGRIAGHGYHNPSLCKAHFVLFEEDVFGVVWLDLDSFSLFDRVKEDLI